MSQPTQLPPIELESLPSADSRRKLYHCGTLKYTAFGLISLFIWLLWGDFIFQLIDQCIPNILPLKLNDLGAGDFTNILLNRTLSYVIIFLFAPAASIASDRHRGPFGRRIPFLFWSTPFVGLFMILIGYHETLANLALSHGLSGMFSRLGVTLTIFGALFVGFDFANIFVNTIYWYLFNDVVPAQFMSRFLACFRIVGGLAVMFYNKLIFPNWQANFKLIFVLGGIAYVVGFMLMCVFVREGAYPPPTPLPEQSGNIVKSTISKGVVFWNECFTHRFYWYFFLLSACDAVGGQIGIFGNLRNVNSLHLTYKQLGDLGFLTSTVSLFLQFPAGWVSDKWGPMRVVVLSRWVGLVGAFIPLVWIFKDFGNAGNLRLMYFLSFVFLPFGALGDAAGLPMYMKILPKDRYGQFSAANAMFRALLAIFGSMLAGVFMHVLANAETVKDWHYRYLQVWALAFQIPATIFLMLMFNFWRRNGGDRGFVPPGTDVETAKGFGALAITEEIRKEAEQTPQTP